MSLSGWERERERGERGSVIMIVVVLVRRIVYMNEWVCLSIVYRCMSFFFFSFLYHRSGFGFMNDDDDDDDDDVCVCVVVLCRS